MAATPEQIDVKVRVEAELSVIRPGDKVLVRMPRETRPEQALYVAERLREQMPDVEVLVLAGVDGVDVYRPGEASEDAER